MGSFAGIPIKILESVQYHDEFTVRAPLKMRIPDCF